MNLACTLQCIKYELNRQKTRDCMNALSSSTNKCGDFLLLSNFSPLRKYQSFFPVSHACQAGARSSPVTKSLVRTNYTSMASALASASAERYSNWTPENLIERVLSLEQQLREQTTRYVCEESTSSCSTENKNMGLTKSYAELEFPTLDLKRYSEKRVHHLLYLLVENRGSSTGLNIRHDLLR